MVLLNTGSIVYQNNIKETSDEEKVKSKWEDLELIQYQILVANIISIVWQTVKRLSNKILEVKGLRIAISRIYHLSE